MAMMLIADSGSTKTDWRLVDQNGDIHQCRTVGLNPYFTSDAEYLDALTEGPATLAPTEAILTVHFYGSGVSNDTQKHRVSGLLKKVFVRAHLHVEHDLLAAARAACGTNEGLVVILGTGANSCTFDGAKITENIMSLGYILGDEGSGADLGKRWIAALLNQRVPNELADAFFKSYAFSAEQVIQRVYRGEQPNRFLASFAPFISKHRKHPYFIDLITGAFNELFERYIKRYPAYRETPIHVCGSVGYYLAPVFSKVAEAHQAHVGTFLKDPVAALTLYHIEHL
jgi:N-acetylglucosamine kinase-like BadF-type ATPase